MIPAGKDLTLQSREVHLKSDVDSGVRAQHHTLGKGHLQAAPGNHEHLTNVPLGAAVVYFGNTDPSADFLILDGRELLRADYADLLAVPGVSFANGPSGAAYFVLPNPTNRDLVGAGGDYALGSTGGSDTKTLTTNEMAAHTHGPGTLSTDNPGDHQHGILRKSGAGSATGVVRGNATADTDGTTMNGGSHTHSVTGGVTGSTGTGAAFSIKNRYLAVNFIIRVR